LGKEEEEAMTVDQLRKALEGIDGSLPLKIRLSDTCGSEPWWVVAPVAVARIATDENDKPRSFLISSGVFNNEIDPGDDR
jgi:hypothetical protein